MLTKSIFNFTIISYLFFILFSCSKENNPGGDITPEPSPIASFTVENNNCTATCAITFTNTSTNAQNYSWDFGDGTTSNDKNPSHTYDAPGEYTVVLTASTETRDDLFSKVVTIQSGLVADFSFPNEDYFAPCEITFTNKSEGAESYLWDFGNGETSAEKNPTSTFQTPGDYTVTLTVYADSEETTTSKNITILENPNPLLGKWNLVSGTFNGVNIPNLTGYRIFGDEDISGANWTGDSKCHMKHGNDRGTVYGAYEISGESLIYGHNMTIISWITNQTNFSKFGVVGLGLQDVDYLIDGENLIITGVNNHGTTVLTYEKD